MRTLDTWNELKIRLKVGELVSGNVKEVHPFGVFVDIGEEFYALAQAPFISDKEEIGSSEFPKEGEFVTGRIQVFSDRRDVNFNQIYISLKDVPAEKRWEVG